jgi:hypothetical protein
MMHHLKKLEKEVSPHTLREKPTLSLGKLHRLRAFLVVVPHMINPTAYGVAPHQPGIEGFQQFGRRTHILHSGIEPKVVAVWVKDHWHSVMDGRGHRVRGRGQNRAGLDPVAVRVFPAVPQPCEREQLPVIDFKTVRLFGFRRPHPFVKTVCRDQTPARFQRIAEGWLGARSFRSCVNHLGGGRRVFRP